jgi:hypothetical protein
MVRNQDAMVYTLMWTLSKWCILCFDREDEMTTPLENSDSKKKKHDTLIIRDIRENAPLFLKWKTRSKLNV